jgi:hypothetical protein
MSETSVPKPKAADYASEPHRFGAVAAASLACSGNACADITTEYTSSWAFTNNGGRNVRIHVQNAFMGGAWDVTLTPGQSANVPFQLLVSPFNANYA